MKLYDSRLAPNPRRVRWFMAEKGIDDIAIVPVDIMAGQHKQPDYVARTGEPHVPALELDDGTTLTESIAICRYLESRHPQPNIFGRDPLEAATMEMWTRRAEMLAATPLMLAVRHAHPALAALETQVPEVAAFNRAAAGRGLQVMDARLAQSPFIAGERIGMADIVLIAGLDFSRIVRFQPDPALGHLARWAAEMRARPAASAGM